MRGDPQAGGEGADRGKAMARREIAFRDEISDASAQLFEEGRREALVRAPGARKIRIHHRHQSTGHEAPIHSVREPLDWRHDEPPL
jgi:hypothetical protein